MTPHKHADVIRAYADGATVQFRGSDGNWSDITFPNFYESAEYRVKPSEPEKQYPVSGMSDDELRAVMAGVPLAMTTVAAWRTVANAALHHAIDSGELITRDDHNVAVMKAQLNRQAAEIRERVARDMEIGEAVAKAMYNAAFGGPRRAYCDIKLDLTSIIAGIKP